MGLYLAVYIADWPRFAREIELIRPTLPQPRRPQDRFDYFAADQLLMNSQAVQWRETDPDRLRWHVDGWIAKYDFRADGYNWLREFESVWSRTRDCCWYLGRSAYSHGACTHQVCPAPHEYDDNFDEPFMQDAQTFLDGVCERLVTTDPAAAQQWSPATAVIQEEPLISSYSPAAAEVLADVWTRLSPRLDDLHPYIDPHLRYEYEPRMREFETFTDLMRDWGTVMMLARERGLGVVSYFW
ncbi:hypothetical protein [Nocardia huaxiensis]|uniref:Uncharacterized protein n=1 Tax=Nocardia huaxiensis TaxID=2755382 RepID=A0A7D6V733_9NOCA|nr:hypothetical protein [Nocardia huaxiensis]QLY28294.1 hypothetical protein H0264_23250 [Nocardia huaxiensis]UFS98266.1 hypothetical protein LPY97_10390 [Nocardia huaxiensis]